MELEVAFFITSVGTTAVIQALKHMKPVLIRNLESVSAACNLCHRKSRSTNLLKYFSMHGGTLLKILTIYLRKRFSSLIRQNTVPHFLFLCQFPE